MKTLAGIWILIIVAALGGWVANIVKLAGMNFGDVTGMLIIRAIGVPLGPLGAVMGYL